MTLTIIAGTHTFVDLTGKFRASWVRSRQKRIIYSYDGITFAKHRFDRVEITKDGDIIRHPSLINPVDNKFYRWTVNQPTGSCKTVLAVYDLARTWARGGRVAANFSFEYMKHNIGKEKSLWTPNLNSIDDVTKANHITLCIDDIKGTAENWQAEESDLISMAANVSRKENVNMIITSQGVTNFVAPNIRRVTTGYEIPYCTVRDQRVDTPDGKGYPRIIEVLSLIPGDMQIGDIFIGFGMLNGDLPDGRQVTPSPELLNSYKSMEIAIGLKADKEGARPNQPGYELEAKAFEYLKENVPGMNWQHLNGKHVFDVISETHAIDIVGTSPDGMLHLDHKDLTKHMRTAKRQGQIPYLMFMYAKEWRFVPITHNLSDLVEGKKIHPSHLSHNRMRTLDKAIAQA